MGENFITVGTQVLELFILIAVGYLCGRIRILNDKTVRSITDIVLYIVCPCVIVENFIRPFDTDMLGGLFIYDSSAFFISFPMQQNARVFTIKIEILQLKGKQFIQSYCTVI